MLFCCLLLQQFTNNLLLHYLWCTCCSIIFVARISIVLHHCRVNSLSSRSADISFRQSLFHPLEGGHRYWTFTIFLTSKKWRRVCACRNIIKKTGNDEIERWHFTVNDECQATPFICETNFVNCLSNKILNDRRNKGWTVKNQVTVGRLYIYIHTHILEIG